MPNAVYEEKVYVTSYVIVNYSICLYLHHRLKPVEKIFEIYIKIAEDLWSIATLLQFLVIQWWCVEDQKEV